ncbi:ABC transporter ATP-binding protein [Allorhizobium sp. BGMRC 0089]|uniref:ABC transporter ATP-binding protein n=1 Tax=Allorhizobium sonneratiae TaxID=2934936 RepID=UPI00203367E9|nr:ABC transporter ATP-binding protein [Allorhizobium sonneratiae]MCM2294668.1 ABC transporter ATP-binding protein [Allorhizobium sonneratiae]
MTATLQCRQISKSLGGLKVLNALDLTVQPGEVVSLLGASGSGKTTLLRAIAGLQDPDDGEISLNDRVIWSRRLKVPAEQRRIGMVFQDYALWPHMTVTDNLAFGLKAARLPAKEITLRIDHALEVTRLLAFGNRYPGELSGGQQQRVAIARLMAQRPALMLFDEPLSNLDAALREDLRSEMMQLVRHEGATVIYVTHDQSEAMAVSDRIAVMRKGEIAQLDTPERIYEAPANAWVAAFIGGFSLVPGEALEGYFRIEGTEGPALTAKGRVCGKAVLVVRPEDIKPADVHPQNQLNATVLTRAYQGRCWRLELKLGQHRIRIDWPEGPMPGTELPISLPPDRLLLLPPPQE